jgi:hypothetical protein
MFLDEAETRGKHTGTRYDTGKDPGKDSTCETRTARHARCKMSLERSAIPPMTTEQVFEYLYDWRLWRLVEIGERQGRRRSDCVAHGVITLWKLDRLSMKRS